MLNALAIYVEEWYHRNDIDIPSNIKTQCKGRVVGDVDKILKLLSERNIKATFFILGSIAEEYPQVVEKIHRLGHEIASHGYNHNLVYEQSREEFKTDLKRSIQLLQNITNEKVLGYTAPSWSIINNSVWALDVLKEEGFLYDSSVFPIKTFLYGIPDFPRFPYKIYGDNGNLIEFPPSTVKFLDKNIPFSGGVFFRILPLWIIRKCLKRINKKEKKPALIYLHSWELNHSQPKLKLPIKKRIIPYANLDGTEEKLRSLLNDFKFSSIRKVLCLK